MDARRTSLRTGTPAALRRTRPPRPPVGTALHGTSPAAPPRRRRSICRHGGRAAIAGLAIAFLLAGCAPGSPGFPAAPSPGDVPDLEERLAEAPDDAELLASLGAARRAAGDPAAALPLLERARDETPSDADVHFFLGLTHEDLGRPGEALAAYETFLERSGDPAVADALRGRLRLLRREELRLAAREALAREAELASSAPAEDRVAVFPFLFGVSDETLRPLSRAVAEMLVNDLAQTDRLTVLERLNVQALLDEMTLAESGLVDPTTAARSGWLLGAGTIVQGRIEGSLEALALDAAVVEITDAAAGDAPSVAVSDAAERLLDMEKQLALDLYEVMGVVLTAAERERVNQRPTENLQALLASGRGLEASDAGDFAEAASQFQQAAALDPGFEAARVEADEAEALAEAAATTTDQLAAAAVPAPALQPVAVPIPEPLARDPAQEVMGTERIGHGPAVLDVILRLPGGGR